MYTIQRTYPRSSGIRIMPLAQLFALIAIILLLVWLLHYREGIELDSGNSYRIFNVHPFLMFFGFIFFAGEAMMAYNTVRAEWPVPKLVHMFLHLMAICFGIVGIHAVFKFHDRENIRDMYTLHSWIGMATFCLFILQWLFGFTVFLASQTSETARKRAIPWHISGGRALLYMAICAAETGLMEKVTLMGLPYGRELYLINFLGGAILLFGITVDLTISVPRHTEL